MIGRATKKGWVGPVKVPPELAAQFTGRYTMYQLSRVDVIRALVELYADGLLDDLVNKKIKSIIREEKKK